MNRQVIVGVKFPYVEVRYENIRVVAECEVVHGKPLPTIWNYTFGYCRNFGDEQPTTVQAYFKLEKPISFLISQITRLEYDISGEIGVPGTQV
ncbi:hypothetical protein HanPI659440_Chr09g0352891 [Helianthus annuus]|nr:hypothetical protein HanPI659440_Chr09g0352891 [Helianthus annuus]